MRIPGAGIVTGTLTIAIPAVARWDFAMSHGICPTCASEVGKQMDDL